MDEDELSAVAKLFLNILMSSEFEDADEEADSNADEEDSGAQRSKKRGPSRTPLSNVVKNPKDFAIFGKHDSISKSDTTFKMIEKYVHNSHLLSPGGVVNVHNIYDLSGKGSQVALANPVKPNPTNNNQGSEEMLLWFKTTPVGIKKLAQGQDGCVAFYDRICRAFTDRPSSLKAPLHQIFVLCVVSLGKVSKDPNGFQHWSRIGQPPPGFDTVKGMGSHCPDWNENYYDNSITIPCGPTVLHQQYRKYYVDFNEYIVFESKRIQVKYAVECEIIPAALLQASGLATSKESDSEAEDKVATKPLGSQSGATSPAANPPLLSTNTPPIPPKVANTAILSPNNPPTPLPGSPNVNVTVIPNNTNTPSSLKNPRSSATQTNNLFRPLVQPTPPSGLHNPNKIVPMKNLYPLPIPRQNAFPGPSTRPPVPLATLLNHSLHLGSSPGPQHPSPVPLPKQLQPNQTKQDGIEPATLKVLMQLPGASSATLQKCLYKAYILTPTDEIYNHIQTYVKNGSVHGYGMKILNIIRIIRDNDIEFRHDPKMKGMQRMMLWHGTNEAVVAGILQTGFKIPAAKNQMFGMGIYFADRASKSANYCGSTKKGGTAYLFLCDVAVGSWYNSKNAKNNYTTPPTVTTNAGATKHFDSLKCTGANIPDESENVDFYGSIIPLGKTIPNTKYPNCTVQYNEFIVYNSSQVKIKYLVKVQFT